MLIVVGFQEQIDDHLRDSRGVELAERLADRPDGIQLFGRQQQLLAAGAGAVLATTAFLAGAAFFTATAFLAGAGAGSATATTSATTGAAFLAATFLVAGAAFLAATG